MKGVIDVVCGVIENEGGRYLACQRPAGKHLGGLWEFPGGKVEPGETPSHALIRELQEELCITVAIGVPLSPVVFEYDQGRIRLLPFLCRISSGTVDLQEHSALQWCAPEDFSKLDWAPADLPILEELSRR